MSNKLSLIEKELSKVKYADLSNHDELTNTYFIKQRKDIKIEEDKSYLIKIKPCIYNNIKLKNTWKYTPEYEYFKFEVNKIIPDEIFVAGIAYDPISNLDIAYFWSGWLTLKDIEVIKKL